jgi:peroxiredoxin
VAALPKFAQQQRKQHKEQQRGGAHMINPGDRAPEFALPDADMRLLKSADFAGRPYVVYFYPKDDTPGCTMEAQEFSDLVDDFAAADCTILGVSKDNCVSHAAFRDKYGLTVQLVADVEGQLCEAYGVWQEKEKNGEKRMGIVRSTFVVDRSGVVRHVMYDVKPKGHAAAVLELVSTL